MYLLKGVDETSICTYTVHVYFLKGVDETQLLAKAKANSKVQAHVLAFIEAEDKAAYVLDLFDTWVVRSTYLLWLSSRKEQ